MVDRLTLTSGTHAFCARMTKRIGPGGWSSCLVKVRKDANKKLGLGLSVVNCGREFDSSTSRKVNKLNNINRCCYSQKSAELSFLKFVKFFINDEYCFFDKVTEQRAANVGYRTAVPNSSHK